jgi:hypothetical protein
VLHVYAIQQPGLEVNVALTNVFTTLVITAAGGSRGDTHIPKTNTTANSDVTNDAYWRYNSRWHVLLMHECHSIVAPSSCVRIMKQILM